MKRNTTILPSSAGFSLVLPVVLLCSALMAQTKFTELQIIPKTKAADGTGTLSFLELRANGTNVFTWKAPDTLSADVVMKWPVDGAAGFLYSDGAGNTSWTGSGGTCGVNCLDLTSVQTASGRKTFSGGVVLQNTSTFRTLNPEADNTYDIGTSSLRIANIWGGNFKSKNGEVIVQSSGGVDRAVLGVNGFTGYDATPTAVNTIYGTGGGFQGFNTTLGYGVAGTYAIDSTRAANLTGFTMATGATNGFCLISDAAGIGTWQSCAAGGSYVTTNTAQTGLTGTKEWNSAHTYKASILSGTNNTYNIGDAATAFANIYSQTMQPENLELGYAGTAHANFWRIDRPTSISMAIWSGSGTQQELDLSAFSSTDTRWFFRGTLMPITTSGSNGDIGNTTFPWRDAYFSGQIKGNTGLLTGAFPSLIVGTSGAQSTTISAGVFLGAGSGGAPHVLISYGGLGSGIIRTIDTFGNVQNGIDSNGISTNVGFSVGPFGSTTQVIDNAGNATFPTLKITTSPSAGYVLTSDASGNATWQAAAGGSFVTTNTNQTALSGTKEWSNTHTFNAGVAVKLGSTARNWDPESDAAYGLGNPFDRWNNLYAANSVVLGNAGIGAAGIILTGGANANWYNSAGVSKVLISSGGSGPTSSGIVRVFNNTATVINGSMDNTGFNTEVGYNVAGTQVIDAFRSVTANGLTAANATFTGNLTVLGTCTGCSSGWTTNTTQTGLSGDKTTSGSLTLTNAGTNRIALTSSTGNVNLYNSSGASRVFLAGSSGIVSVYTGSAGSETPVIRLTTSGVDMNNLAQSGQSTSVVIGGCTMNFTYGWLTSKSGC
jgi:hypothetical protein